MTAIARDQDEKLQTLDKKAADTLERLAHEALDLVGFQNRTSAATAAHRLPPDSFKKIADDFGPESFERALQGNN